MSQRARVFVSGVPAGMLEREGHSYVFSYDSDYPRDGQPVSLTMPPSVKRYVFAGRLPPYFEGLMYEGWYRRLASGVAADTESSSGQVAYLIEKCADSIGAIEIAADGATEPQKIDPITFDEPMRGDPRIARELCLVCFTALPTPGHNRNYHENCAQAFFGTDAPPVVPFGGMDFERLAVRSISSGIAIPGVQPKLSIYYPAGDAHFIMKPQVSGVRSVPEIENLWMRLYEMLGIPVAKSALVETSDGELAYVTRRFDRLPGGRKIHVEDFGQLLGKSIVGDEKFDASVSEMVNDLRKRSSPRARVSSVDRLFKLTVLNIAFGNSDAHLKNHSMVGVPDRGGVIYALSPAYDLLPTFFLSANSRTSSALRINAKTRDITRKDLEAEAKAAGFKGTIVAEILHDLETRSEDVSKLMRSSLVPQGKIDELLRRVNDRRRSLGVGPIL